MQRNKQKRRRLPIALSLGVVFVPVLLSIAQHVFGGESDPSAFLERPSDTSKGCVEKTDYMRFYHMDLLKTLREQAVREGTRGAVTFDTCKTCHPSRERFCNRCHEAASVRLDCFGCHDDTLE